MKFIPRCQLSVEVAPDAEGTPTANIVIPPEITIEFEISRQSWSASQTGTFRIKNLNEQTRNLLHKDAYALTERRAIQFRAGYEQFLPLCFNGQVITANSYRTEGSPEFITEITAFDGGFPMVNGWTSINIAAGITVTKVLTDLAQSLPQITSVPIIGDFPQVNRKSKVLFGNTWSVILSESENLATIDNGQVKALHPHEVIDAQIPVINASTGLLGSPRRSATNFEFQMIFEPRLTLGQIVQVDSSSNRAFNGLYKVLGFTHRGVISPTQNGKRTTTALLFFGKETEWQIVKGQLVQ